MTTTLVVLGDSLMDAGNVSGLFGLIGQEPFSDSIYDKGNNVKASDGLVLSEHTIRWMGGDLKKTQNFNILSADAARPADIHNYAHGGALSGEGPSQSLFGMNIDIGLSSQVKKMRERSSFYRKQSDVDVLLSAGGNDLLEASVNNDQFKKVLLTQTKVDNRRYGRSISQSIAGNIIKAVDQITGLVDEVVVYGALPVSKTPRVKTWIKSMKGVNSSEATQLLNNMSKKINRELSTRFQNDPSVVLIDSSSLWKQTIKPKFVDDIHPTSRTSRRVAKLAVSTARRQLKSFGFNHNKLG